MAKEFAENHLTPLNLAVCGVGMRPAVHPLLGNPTLGDVT